jgi:hypothetical protein
MFSIFKINYYEVRHVVHFVVLFIETPFSKILTEKTKIKFLFNPLADEQKILTDTAE